MTRGKKSILVVALVLALCAAMLFGATVAWFTKTTTTNTNTIKVADYNVNLKYATTWSTEDNGWTALTDSAQLFIATGENSDTALKPGDKTGVKYIKIINNNDYAIKATVDIGAITQAIGTESSSTVPDTDKLKLYALKTGVNGTSDTLTAVEASTEDGKTFTLDNISIAAATTESSTTTPGTAIIAIQFELPDTAVTPSVSNTFTIDVKTEQAHDATESTT